MNAFRVVLGAAFVAGSVAAQTAPKPSTALMRGEVQNEAGAPLEGADVSILGIGRDIRTGARGVYRIDSIVPGKYWVVVRRIGYAPLRVALSFSAGQDREIVFQLEAGAQALPELQVKAENDRWNRRHADFVWRSKFGSGYFLTRDDLEKHGMQYLNWVVRRYVPVFYGSGWGNAGNALELARGWGAGGMLGWGDRTWGGGWGGCSPAVSVNGNRPFGWGLSDFRADEVEAVEIYRSLRQMPIEFQQWNVGCGLVVVWTTL